MGHREQVQDMRTRRRSVDDDGKRAGIVMSEGWVRSGKDFRFYLTS